MEVYSRRMSATLTAVALGLRVSGKGLREEVSGKGLREERCQQEWAPGK